MIRSVPPAAAAAIFPLPLPPRLPGWALPQRPVSGDAEAAFHAGAALHALDNVVRGAPSWAASWRLAPAGSAAAASPERPCDDMCGLDTSLGEARGNAADFLD